MGKGPFQALKGTLQPPVTAEMKEFMRQIERLFIACTIGVEDNDIQPIRSRESTATPRRPGVLSGSCCESQMGDAGCCGREVNWVSSHPIPSWDRMAATRW
jgi:hypothetical protein